MKITKNGYEILVNENGYIEKISAEVNGKQVDLLLSDAEFLGSFGAFGGQVEVLGDAVKITAENQNVKCESLISFYGDCIARKQKYLIKESFTGYISTRFKLVDTNVLYTYPLRKYEEPITQVGNIRNDYLWAVPLLSHIWRNDEYICAYFVDRTEGVGTCDIQNGQDGVTLGFYYPDKTEQTEIIMPFSESGIPKFVEMKKGEEIVFSEYIICKKLDKQENSLIQAEKIISDVLLFDKPMQTPDYENTAKGIAYYYNNNDLWDENAFGENKGWYFNMWKRTYGGVPEKDFYYDLGWGEGYGAITISSLVRYSLRVGTDEFKDKIRSMTNSIDEFLRSKDEKGVYYDRIIPLGKPSLLGNYLEQTNCDFLGIYRIWTHSLAMVGYQFANLYEECKHYDEELSQKWFSVARDIADFLISKQDKNGDIQDGFDKNDKECNKKKHRIPARAVACGLFAMLFRLTGDKKYLTAGENLAKAVAPEILKYEFYNQMLDAHVDVVDGKIVESGSDESAEIYDAENACYAFLGLTELYAHTKDENVLKLCKNCAAYFISWMYFYDVPTGANGYSRGATVCRMPDFALCYIGAGNFATPALIKFATLTGDDFYEKIAKEMIDCACRYQWKDSSVKWYGAVVHAVYQVNGKHWGPDIQGQMDTGMTSGTTLMNIEKILRSKNG